ncbi:UvrD-helicase domain-containing protein [Thermogemmata fonticola]|uniref:DNA 3'-5' helicase n=1 Tax=Thermogemmata fonticola TaxID=2755323 RepID=A0A7V8VDM4_9BACT|nr:UvrD-helicase domain-containing protein [Thermogemmata fonticola]MBA2226095.1 UvrD-helicase domain-containing protein [Thermogemmata fonticola]
MSGWTEQQREAITRRNTSVVLSAGAGCGKTFVLTQRYVSHLESDGATPRQIVAITFTERAAREMRERIRRELRQRWQQSWQQNDPQAFARWQTLLLELEQAQITTIHAFCSALLRRYAIPAGLDPSFTVLDELQAVTWQQEHIRETLPRLLLHSQASAAESLRQLLHYFSYSELLRAIEGLLAQEDCPAWEEWLRRSPEEIVEFWREQAVHLRSLWVRHLRRTDPRWVAVERLLPRLAVHSNSLGRLAQTLGQLLKELSQPSASPDTLDRLREAARIQGIPRKDWPDDTLKEQTKTILADFREALKRDAETFDSQLWQTEAEGILQAARISQHWLAVALWVAKDAHRRKSQDDALSFQDLLLRCRDLVRDHPNIRKELQDQYRFLLLDELQDTDPVQMELIKCLCGDQLTSGKLFAVGDHKQSIYRFRGAEVELFLQLRQQMPPEGRLDLTRNFRSQAGVLHFVNALFRQHLSEYVPLEAHRRTEGSEVPVEFLWVVPAVADQAEGKAESKEQEEEAGKKPSEEGEEDGEHEGPARQRRRLEAAAVAQRIQELLADPTPRLWGRDTQPRRLRPRDIVLLFRAMTHVDIYEAALQEAGIDYYLVGGWAFFAQQEIYDILNVVRAIENPHDSIPLAGALRSPLLQVSDDSLAILAQHRDGLWGGLRDAAWQQQLPAAEQEVVRRAARLLQQWQRQKDRLPLARLLGQIVADTAYDAALQFEPLGERKLANLWKILDLAREFEQGGLFGLHEFADRLQDLIARQPKEEQAATVPEEADVVRLMSIHQAKGLEFPVVFLPDLAGARRSGWTAPVRWHRTLGCLVQLPSEWKMLPEGQETLPFSPLPCQLGQKWDALADTEEEWRIFYVACTRAADRLILSAALQRPLEPHESTLPLQHNPWTLLLEDRFDLIHGVCRDPAESLQVRVRFVEARQLTASPLDITAGTHPNSATEARSEIPARGMPAEINPNVATEPNPLRTDPFAS